MEAVESGDGEGKDSTFSSSSSSSLSPSCPRFERRVSALIPLDAPRPLQIALGTGFIKIRLRQSVEVLRRRQRETQGQRQNSTEGDDTWSPLPPLDAIEFRSVSKLWVPEGSNDLPLGHITIRASYSNDGDVEGGACAPAEASTDSGVRFDVTAVADFRPEGFLTAFKTPLDAVMLSSQRKTAREISSWFAARSAEAAGATAGGSPPPPPLVAPKLPKELAYLHLRRLSLDGPPGESRGISAEEADELHRAALAASARALALVLRLGRATSKHKQQQLQQQLQEHHHQHQPATPEKDLIEQRLPSSRVSMVSSLSSSSLESFASAASELPLPESDDDAAPLITTTPAAKKRGIIGRLKNRNSDISQHRSSPTRMSPLFKKGLPQRPKSAGA